MHCLGVDKRIIVGGSSGFTLPVLILGSLNCNKIEDSLACLQGRTLMAQIQEHIRDCKKALLIVNRFDIPCKSFNLTESLLHGGLLYVCLEKTCIPCLLRTKSNQEGRSSSSVINSDD
jgi:hypothetical protein